MNTNEDSDQYCICFIVNESSIIIFKVNIHSFVVSHVLINVNHSLSPFFISGTLQKNKNSQYVPLNHVAITLCQVSAAVVFLIQSDRFEALFVIKSKELLAFADSLLHILYFFFLFCIDMGLQTSALGPNLNLQRILSRQLPVQYKALCTLIMLYK